MHRASLRIAPTTTRPDDASNKITNFVNDLKSKNDATRIKGARELRNYVTSELLEMSDDEINTFIETFDTTIFNLLMKPSTDPDDLKAAIYSMMILVESDAGNKQTRCARFANYLRLHPLPTDASILELEALAVARIAQNSGPLTGGYVDYEIKRSIEWITSDDRSEAKRHAGVC